MPSDVIYLDPKPACSGTLGYIYRITNSKTTTWIKANDT